MLLFVNFGNRGNKKLFYLVNSADIKALYSTGDNMKRLILMVALGCAWTSIVFANPVLEQQNPVSETVSGEKVGGFCDPDNFGDIYLGTAVGIPLSIFLLGAFVAFVAGQPRAVSLGVPALIAVCASVAAQIGLSSAYKAKCGDLTAID